MQRHWLTVTVISSLINFLSYGDVSVPKYFNYWRCRRSMRSRVYETVRCPSVCPIRPLYIAAVGLLLWAQRVGDIDQLLHGWRRSSTTRSSKCGG